MKPGAKKALTCGVKLAVMAGLLAFLYSRVDLGSSGKRWGISAASRATAP